MSNQSLKPLALKTWKDKISSIGNSVTLYRSFRYPCSLEILTDAHASFSHFCSNSKRRLSETYAWHVGRIRYHFSGKQHRDWFSILLRFIEKPTDTIIDKNASFFVGDAAGRQYPSKKSDFSSTDRKLAQNIEIPFHTPEVSPFTFVFPWLTWLQEFFLKLQKHESFFLPGFHVSSIPKRRFEMP